jgi:Skp family chaperone for outer membrane proteins
MKKNIIFIFVFLLVQTLYSSQLIKIAIVDMPKVSANYKEFQDKYVDLTEKKDEIFKSIKKEEEQIAQLEQELGMGILESEILRRQRQILQKKSELQTFHHEAMKIMNQREENLIQEARENIAEAIKFIAIRRGISIVFSKSGILFAAEAYVDLSNEIIEHLNQ